MNRLRPVRSLPRDVRGLSLVELLIGVALGIVVVGAIVSTFVANKQSYRATEGLSRVQENARLVFELLTRDLRAARSSPCGTPVSSNVGGSTFTAFGIVNQLANKSNANAWWAKWEGSNSASTSASNELRGYDAGVAFPGATFTQSATADSIQVMGVAASGTTGWTYDPSNSRFTRTINAETGLVNGDIVMGCTFNGDLSVRSTIFQTTTVSNTQITYGTAGNPGNASANLLERTNNYWLYQDTNLNTAGTSSGSTTTEAWVIVPFQSVAWYVGNNGRAGCAGDACMSLYRLRLVNSGGVIAPQAEEIVDGVRDFQLSYLRGGHVAYETAAQIGPSADSWREVVAINVTLNLATLENSLATGGVTGNASRLNRVFTTAINLRNNTAS